MMKVKILLIPLFLLLAVLLLIWVVAPQFIVVKGKYMELNEKRDNVSKTEEKITIANNLKGELEENEEGKKTVENFLPEQMEAEEIIDNLNYIASSEGVSIAALSVDQPEKKLIVPGTAGTGSAATAFSGSGDDTQMKNMVVNPADKIIDFKASYNIIGDYSNIKNVISKLYKLKRFNRISEINIEKINPQNIVEGETGNNSLRAEMEIAFTYLSRENRLTDVNDQIFSQGKFDLAVLEKIEERKTLDVLETRATQSGKSNPFIP